MKIAFNQTAQWLQRMPDGVAAVLVYGPDHGLVRERAEILARQVNPAIDDPFQVTLLDADKLNSDPAALVAEAQTLSLFGGKRLLWVRGASDGFVKAAEALLQQADPNTAITIIEADELGPRSPLRKLFESAANAGALPCYADDAQSAGKLLDDALRESGWRITPDARQRLLPSLLGDRQIARSELEKLFTYMGTPAAGADSIQQADVEAVCLDHTSASLEEWVYAWGDQQPNKMAPLLAKLLQEDVSFVVIARNTLRHAERIAQVQMLMGKGDHVDDAMNSLNPAVFFKQAPKFKQQVQRWNFKILQRAMAQLYQLELAGKQGGVPAELLVEQLMLLPLSRQ